MPSKHLRHTKAKSEDAPPSATSFRQIKGITQLIEAHLHRAGIKTFDELVNLQPEEILAAIGNLKSITVNQIVEQDWLGQARKLSAKRNSVSDTMESEGFIVNLFLSGKTQVHSTQILHVNSDEGEKWDGWDSQRLLDFIVNRSGLILPKAAPVAKETVAVSRQETVAPSVVPQATPETIPLVEPTTPLLSEVVAFEMIPAHSEAPSKLVHKGEPFDVRLSLDAEQIMSQNESSLDYIAAIMAKGFETATRVNLGEARGVLSDPKEPIIVSILHQDLAPGTYRLEAALTLCRKSQVLGKPTHARTIFQVF